MKKTNKLIAGLVLGAVLATGVSAYGIVQPTFKKGSTFGIQAKSVSFDDKLQVDESPVYGLYYGFNWDLGNPGAWGVKFNFELDFGNMKDSKGEDFTYSDYYATVAPTYTFEAGKGNIRVYAGGKFGFVGFENDTDPAYGAIAGIEYNYKALNLGVSYMSGTMSTNAGDFDISEIAGYIGYNF